MENDKISLQLNRKIIDVFELLYGCVSCFQIEMLRVRKMSPESKNWTCCFGLHVRTATIIIGLWHLVSLHLNQLLQGQIKLISAQSPQSPSNYILVLSFGMCGSCHIYSYFETSSMFVAFSSIFHFKQLAWVSEERRKRVKRKRVICR